MVWNSFRTTFYSSNYSPNNLQRKQNMALRCEMINSVIPNARSWCWDQFQHFQAPKFANNTGGKGFLNASWPRCSWGTTHGTHTQKKAHAPRWCISKGKEFPEEAVSRKLRWCCNMAMAGLPEWLESPWSRSWHMWLPKPGVKGMRRGEGIWTCL